MRTSDFRVGFICLLAIVASGAAAQTSGTYSTGTGYSIEVKFEGDSLTVIEPNKRSQYRKTGKNVYEFTNTNNNHIRYGLCVVDAKTLEAFKPVDQSGTCRPGTKLTLASVPAAKDRGTASTDDAEKYERIAQSYLQRAQSDSSNVHVWTTCGAAAFSRSTSSVAEADRYASQAASMIKPIMTGHRSSPCPEVISDAIWAAAK